MNSEDAGISDYSRLTSQRQALWVQRHATATGYRIDLAKWLLASLLVVNGGSLIALLNSPDRVVLVPQAGPWFAIGVGASIGAGFLAWLNASLNADVFEDLIDPLIAVDPKHFTPITRAKSIGLYVTNFGTILVGIGSLAFAAGGAESVEATVSHMASAKALPAAHAANSLPPCRAPIPQPSRS